MLARDENFNHEIVKCLIKNKNKVKLKGKVQEWCEKKSWPARRVSPECRMTHVLCDACTTPPLSSCKPWESGCAVPNHSYNIANVELPLNKGVCKDAPRQISAMPS